MIETIEKWAQKVDDVGHELLPADSELAADGAIFVVFRPDEVVFQCLQSAITHLNFLAHWLKRTDRQWHQVHLTILRTASMGATQGLYVIGPPEQAARQARAIQIMCNDFRYEKQRLASGVVSAEQRDTRLQELDSYLADAKAKGIQLGHSIAAATTTDIIKNALGLMPSQGESHDMFVQLVDILRRAGSAHAHATPYLKWTVMPVEQKTDRGDGIEIGHGKSMIR